MEKNFVLNGNKLIAKFMNFKIDIENKNGLFTLNSTMDKIESEVSYHKSWDWLMPVVEKCTSIWNDFEFDSEERLLIEEEIWNIDGTLSDFLNGDIEAIYRRSIRFIEWYNEQNK